jgi:2-oxoglutarate ferredoxin oxidoreductase subunit beta
MDASFVARAFTGDIEQTKDILKKAITHRGFALVDVLQPCVSFNKINTMEWFREHSYYLEDSYSPSNKKDALENALQTEKMPLGILYHTQDKKIFEENTGVYRRDKTPLSMRDEASPELLLGLIRSKR